MAKPENDVLVEGNERKEVDSNNNSNNNNNNNNENNSEDNCSKECRDNKSSSSGGKYQLRPRSIQARRRSDSEWSFHEPLRQKRPPPLSRYRRKTANARERYRMRQINTAFENLRGVLPSWVCSRRAASDMTKITTLKLASAYIRSLQDILDGNTHHDTCSWVLSAILEDSSASHEEPQPSPESTNSNNKCQLSSTHLTPPEADLMSLLCGSATDSSQMMMIQDNLEVTSSFPYLSTVAESDPITLLLLDSESHRYWNEGQQSPLVV